jgi:hypothetical protein
LTRATPRITIPLVRGIVSTVVAGAIVLSAATGASASITLGHGIDGVKLGEAASSLRRHLGPPHVVAPGREWSYSGDLSITFDRHLRVLSVWTESASQKTARGIHTMRYTNIGSGPAKSPQPGTGSTKAEVLQAYPTTKCAPGPTIGGVTQPETRCRLLSRLHNRAVETTFVFQSAGSAIGDEVAEIFVSYTHE